MDDYPLSERFVDVEVEMAREMDLGKQEYHGVDRTQIPRYHDPVTYRYAKRISLVESVPS